MLTEGSFRPKVVQWWQFCRETISPLPNFCDGILFTMGCIYSIYSQPITTRYMQIGTIEAKYKGKITHNPSRYN